MTRKLTGNQIRQTFIDFFVQRGHTAVPSMSLVPGGDSTLLFTNSGMVQFKDVFLGVDKRAYVRAVDSQKCMRVAGKHNDLEDVGRDDSHHTFFEMLGNWSFGNYYKKEAIAWSWELLTEVWGLPKDRLYATCFKDDEGDIPQDDEAAEIWKEQPGFDPAHVYFFGRKENFWRMADTGPCGPCSEIHLDLGEERDNLRGVPHKCGVNGECNRFLELWNNVFIQYNQFADGRLEPLPAKHVDTGMGFERIVAVLQGVDSNYKSDLFEGALNILAELTDASREQIYANFTPYRVICDHARSAAFLIGDGVVPGNGGRNYVTRMLIRRAARFGTKIGLTEPFLARVADAFIAQYGDHYVELKERRESILDHITREEIRFARTLDAATARLQTLLDELRAQNQTLLEGRKAFDLYSTYGMPFEISRDIAREQGMDIEQQSWEEAKEAHKLASGGGKPMGELGGEDADLFAALLRDLQAKNKLGPNGVEYNPYGGLKTEGEILALVTNGVPVSFAELDDEVEVLLPKTSFYVEAGGQVSDTGYIRGADWEIEVTDMRKPATGVYVHVGTVISGRPKVGDLAKAEVNAERRHDVMRNHTATHLLHKALHEVLGKGALQAGSLVAPSHLRFDFTHPTAMTAEQIERVERLVNEAIAKDMPVRKESKSLEEAKKEGAMALFGEKYDQTVRTISILQDENQKFSYELCGGTHLERTSDVGVFIIVSESSAAANVRRIEALTGRGAYEFISKRLKTLKQAAAILKTGAEDVPARAAALESELNEARKQIAALKTKQAFAHFERRLAEVQQAGEVRVLAAEIPEADAETLRALADQFRQKYPQNGVAALYSDGMIIAALTDDLVKCGWKAAEFIAAIGGKGGGRPNLAQGSLPKNGKGALEKVAELAKAKSNA